MHLCLGPLGLLLDPLPGDSAETQGEDSHRQARTEAWSRCPFTASSGTSPQAVCLVLAAPANSERTRLGQSQVQN